MLSSGSIQTPHPLSLSLSLSLSIYLSIYLSISQHVRFTTIAVDAASCGPADWGATEWLAVRVFQILYQTYFVYMLICDVSSGIRIM